MNKRKKPTPETDMKLNVKALMMLLLPMVEACSLGVLTAFLPPGVAVSTMELTKSGAMILISKTGDQAATWEGESPLTVSIQLIWRGDSKAPSAGEILKSIQDGLTAMPLSRREEYDIMILHVKNQHTGFMPGAEGAAGVDSYESHYELVMVKTVGKESAQAIEITQA